MDNNSVYDPLTGATGAGGERWLKTFSPVSLEITQLVGTKIRDRDGEDVILAQCPACAEDGHDHTHDHLIVFQDGRFGCVIFPGDKEHRQRIWQLAGKKRGKNREYRKSPSHAPPPPSSPPPGLKTSLRIIDLKKPPSGGG